MAKLSVKDRRRRHFNRYHDAKSEYESYWRPTHKDIADYSYPQGGRFLDETPNDGKRRDSKIFNATAQVALRALIAGLFSFITSPVKKWIKLSIKDATLKELQEVKEYFDELTDLLMTTFGESNLYTTLISVYGDYAAFGTGGMQVDADIINVFRFTPLTIGSYFIGEDERGDVSEIYREFPMRARNIVEMFGIDNVTQTIKDAVTGTKSGNRFFNILHVQEKNVDRDVTRLDSKNKPWLSMYYQMDSGENDPPLRESGYDTKPFIALRWQKTGSEIWGRGPGEMMLGDNKMLQTMVSDKSQARAKQVKPPLNIVGNADSVDINAGAGGASYSNAITSPHGSVISPLYQVDIDVNGLSADIIETQNMINTICFTDLFLLLTRSDRTRQTATEVLERKNEQLRLFGPIGEQFIPDFIPLVERCIDLLDKAGRLPDAPEIIQGLEYKIEVVSLIRQAQLATVISPIEATVDVAQRMAQIWPDVTRKINPEQTIDEIAEAYGAPAGITKDDETVQAEKDAEAAEAAREQELLETQAAIDSAKTMSDTDVSGDNALTAAAGGLK